MNAHAEELRDHFVAHEGKQKLEVHVEGTQYSVDFGSIARQMTAEIEKSVVNETLTDWILLDFTTTTKVDTTVCCHADVDSESSSLFPTSHTNRARCRRASVIDTSRSFLHAAYLR
ncbi:hypothetical protein AcV7_007067 [Taiwanofungus camphoratus]|nr:hypothetical protein AcV7_007067 [Antrodia cinnamomea]